MSVLENQRTETPFTARDNMLDIWEQVTELSFRGFGKRKRKLPKIPRNFEIWSPESQERWRRSSAEQTAQYEAWDMNFIRNESRIVDDLCRKIVYAIDQANTINPQYLCECDKQRLLQDEAISLSKVEAMFRSWIVAYKPHMSKKQISKLIKLYQDLFGGGLNAWMNLRNIA